MLMDYPNPEHSSRVLIMSQNHPRRYNRTQFESSQYRGPKSSNQLG
ncbi:hypothetical protein NPIL_287841, partial [Nephila pilipes]